MTWVIPSMPLYDEFRSADHESEIFLHASMGVMIVSFTIVRDRDWCRDSSLT